MNNKVPWYLRDYFEEADAWLQSRSARQPLKANLDPKKLILILDKCSQWPKEDWKKCLQTANRLIDLAPELSAGWLYRARAERELGSPKKALKTLLPIAPRFPDSWQIPFYISCFYSASKQYKKAGVWLENARGISHENVMSNELCEPDLSAYWRYRSRIGLAHRYEFSRGD
jgi:tetratricopeptide (TPR) repeat protein